MSETFSKSQKMVFSGYMGPNYLLQRCLSKQEKTTMNILLIFPHQLYELKFFPKGIDSVHVIEEPLFFSDSQYPLFFHKQKLMLHRASIDAYCDYLQDKSISFSRHDALEQKRANQIIEQFPDDAHVHYFDPADYTLEKRIEKGLKDTSLSSTCHDSPSFLNSRATNSEYLENSSKPRKVFRMHHFYQFQRRRLNIMIEDGGPVGGQWSYDADNRKKIPKNAYASIPNEPIPNKSDYVRTARSWVEEHFPDNPGQNESFYYPVTHKAAKKWLKDFLAFRFADFGVYEDAMTTEHGMLWHSVLSPLINCGLLTPQYVIDQALAYADTNNIPLNSLEGFIRQIIGWREFMKASYDHYGVSMRTANDWNHTNKLNDTWYKGTTGLEPLDTVIKKTLKTAYAHHIERLMVVGATMFMSNLHPDQVYAWFMEMYIDAYDWVMVGNIYGMSQDSKRGLLVTKPYFSGSNYILKMSDYKKSKADPDSDKLPWNEVWDALYWSFIIENASALKGNIRWSMMVNRVESFDQPTVDRYLSIKSNWLKYTTNT